MLSESKDSNLEYKIRVLKMEIRESKKEMDKYSDNLWYSIIAFIALIIAGPYFYFVRQEKELWLVILSVALLLFLPIMGFWSFNDYKKKQKQVEKLEKELARLKKGLKKED